MQFHEEIRVSSNIYAHLQSYINMFATNGHAALHSPACCHSVTFEALEELCVACRSPRSEPETSAARGAKEELKPKPTCDASNGADSGPPKQKSTSNDPDGAAVQHSEDPSTKGPSKPKDAQGGGSGASSADGDRDAQNAQGLLDDMNARHIKRCNDSSYVHKHNQIPQDTAKREM